MADEDVVYKIKYKGKLVSVELNDLSNQRLREMKRRFGQSYGTPAGLISLLQTGDMDAISCMIWVGQQKPGWKGEVEDPLEMDFSLADLEKADGPDSEEPKKAARPTKAAGSTSAPTSENSETSTSSTSSPSEE